MALNLRYGRMWTLNNNNKLDFVSCSSCGAALGCDAIAVEEESSESGGGQETVLRVFASAD